MKGKTLVGKKYKKWKVTIVFIYLGQYEHEYKFEYQGEIKNLSLIKSSVQKSFRRMEVDRCLMSFKVLAALNGNSALKRLGVIIIEDSIYLSLSNTLIWLMICKSYFQFKLTKTHWEWVFKLVKFYTESVNIRAIERTKDPLWINNDINVTYDDINILKVDEDKRNVLLSLLLFNDKNTFTLKGDQILGYYYIRRFLSDYQKNNSNLNLPDINELSINLDNLNYITIGDINIVSCDFHCDRLLIPLLQQQIKNKLSLDINNDFIKKCIWYCCSSINRRRYYDIGENKEVIYNDLISEEYIKLWSQIEIMCYQIIVKRLPILAKMSNEY